MDLELQAFINDVKFDPEDDITKGLRTDQIMYYVYVNDTLITAHSAAQTKNMNSSFTCRLTAAQMNDESGVLRLMARDASRGTNVADMGLVGTISFNLKQYFKQMPQEQYGQTFTQWVTLFDHPEDDEYDGDFGEDDEEEPMIKCHFKVTNPILNQQVTRQPVQVASPALAPSNDRPSLGVTSEQRSPQNKYESRITLENQQRPSDPSPTAISGGNRTLKAGSPRFTTAAAQRMSSQEGHGTVTQSSTTVLKSTTQTFTSTTKRTTAVVQRSATNTLNVAEAISPTYQNKRSARQNAKNDIFGDFFGFGDNPEGCMAKDGPAVDIKKEKDKYLSLLELEAKRYNIQSMYTDLNHKTEQIVKSIFTEQKNIINDEEKQLRNLDKLEYMNQYIQEDFAMAQKSLNEANEIRTQSKKEMENQKVQNDQDISSLEQEVKQMQALIEQQRNQQQKVKEENERLQKAIQDGRNNDFPQNKQLTDSILQKDKEFDKVHKDVQQLTESRLRNLKKFHQETEQHNNQTQKTENILNEKEQTRLQVYLQREKLENEFSSLTEQNLKAQSTNYNLSYQEKLMKQKAEKYSQRINTLHQKLQSTAEYLNKQIKDQADRANDVSRENQKLESELKYLDQEAKNKSNSVDKLNDANAQIKAKQYDREIEDLQRKFKDQQRNREQFLTQIQYCHSQWTSKLTLFVTDMTYQSQKTQSDLKQIHDLLEQFRTVSEKQQKLMSERRNHLSNNFEEAEQQEFINHLQDQIQDCDQMIEETEQQIEEIQEQINKINAALEERQNIINDQISQLNVIRQQKIDLDKQIQLQASQITELNRHIDRYESDIERLTMDKEKLIAKLNELSQAVAQKIDDIEEIEMLLRDKDKIIEIMNRRIKEKSTKPIFNMPKGDLLDQMLSHYINQANCLVPIKKLGNGFYLFGTKKIYAKILNGKLVIRVGGGFMIIEEFIATYQDAELLKMSKMSNEQLTALGHDNQMIYSAEINPDAKLSQYQTRKSMAAGRSPGGLLAVGVQNNKMNGTKRQTVVLNKVNYQ